MPVIELGFDDIPPAYLKEISEKKNELRKNFGRDARIFLTPRRIIISAREEKIGNPDELVKKLIDITSVEYKKMRWLKGQNIAFVRPLRWILALSGEHIIPIEIFGVRAGRETKGHRALGNKKIQVESEAEFFTKLEQEGKVQFSHIERRRTIENFLRSSGVQKYNLHLLDILTFSTEYVSFISAKISSDGIPPKIVQSILEDTVFVFPKNPPEDIVHGKIDSFIAVVDNPYQDEEKVREGYLFVIKSRFDDARFYIKEDEKIPFGERVHILENIIYNELFGSFYDRSVFTSKIADFIYAQTGRGERTKLKRASMLYKADITTGLFREFPEHQGYIGMVYAIESGEDEEVAISIYESRLPEKHDDPLPSSETGTIISVADKLLHVFVSFISSLEITSEEDPYGIRRSARGTLRTIIEKNLDIKLDKLIEFLLPFFTEHLRGKISEDVIEERIKNAFSFLMERLENMLVEKFPVDIVRGVIRTTTSPYEAYLKAKALSENEFSDLFYVARRVRNIIEQASKKGIYDITENPYLETEVEKKLLEKAEHLAEKELVRRKMYSEFIAEFRELRKYVDDFFNSVMVLCDDIEKRKSRLTILTIVHNIIYEFADFSEIEKR